MTLSPLHARPTLRFLKVGSFCVFAAVALVAPVQAQNAVGPTNRCARMGDNFVAVSGTDGCVRIGGHIRVDIAKGPQAPMGYAAMDGVQRASERSSHVRAMAPFGLEDLFPR